MFTLSDSRREFLQEGLLWYREQNFLQSPSFDKDSFKVVTFSSVELDRYCYMCSRYCVKDYEIPPLRLRKISVSLSEKDAFLDLYNQNFSQVVMQPNAIVVLPTGNPLPTKQDFFHVFVAPQTLVWVPKDTNLLL